MNHKNEINKNAELEQFLALVRSGDFLILDTETTGLHDGEICQIAIIDNNANVLLDTFVKTVFQIPLAASVIHGIYDEHVATAPGWSSVAPMVLDILGGRNVIIYNAVYDRKMMHKSAEKVGMEKIDWKTLATFHCAMEMYAIYYGQWNEYHGSYRWQKLTHAAHTEGVEIKDAHSALGDCLLTWGVIQSMAGLHDTDMENCDDGTPH
jgi:DNA polymerase-3 subunit epsilon